MTMDLDWLVNPPRWQEQALCAQTDPELWFPEKGSSTTDAKRICSRCPVEGECLDAALNGPYGPERFGVWGNRSERERRRLLPATPTIEVA